MHYRSPEGKFVNVGILKDIYNELKVWAMERRQDREQPLILRIHVGECNTDAMVYDGTKEISARENVQLVLDMVEELRNSGRWFFYIVRPT